MKTGAITLQMAALIVLWETFGASASAFTKDELSTPSLEQQPKLQASVREDSLQKSLFFSSLIDNFSWDLNKSKFGFGSKAVSSANSLANFLFDLRGFDWSKEGANAILEEKLKPQSPAAKEFLLHRENNERQLAIVNETLQMASVFANSEQKKRASREKLLNLIGAENLDKIENQFQSVLRSAHASEGVQTHQDYASTDVEQRNLRIKLLLEAASRKDPVVASITKRLHKYNHRSKLLQITAKAVYATMGVASFAPTLVAPIAETTLLTFMMVTGGPEQDKLLKEVYLSKCLESRANLINEKVHLAVEFYDKASLTKNLCLLACAKDLITQMTNDSTLEAFVDSQSGDQSLVVASPSEQPTAPE